MLQASVIFFFEDENTSKSDEHDHNVQCNIVIVTIVPHSEPEDRSNTALSSQHLVNFVVTDNE